MKKLLLSVFYLLISNVIFFGCGTDEVKTELGFKDPMIEIPEGSTASLTIQSNEPISSKDSIYLVISGGTAIYNVDFTTSTPIKNDTLRIHGVGLAETKFQIDATCDIEFESEEFVEFEIVKFSRGINTGTNKKLLVNISDEDSNNSCLYFDGVDDYIDLGNIYDNLELPLTVEAWVNVNPTVGYTFPIFVSQDNQPIYNGFQFLVGPTSVSVEYGDGRGENNSAYRNKQRLMTFPINGFIWRR